MNLSDFGVYRLDTYDDVRPFFDWLTATLDSGVPISIDTETGSVLDLYKPRTSPGTGYCRLWQIGTSSEGWAIDAREWHGVVDTAMSMVSKARNKIVFANCKFDQHVFAKEGWTLAPWHRVEDVVTMHRLTRSYEDRHGLKPACEQEFGVWAVAGQNALNNILAENKWTWETVPTDCLEYFGYGVMDCCLTVMLYEALLPEQTWWYEVEMEYLRLTFNMERKGLLIDFEKLDIAESMWREQVAEHAKQLKILGFSNPSQNKAVAESFAALGFEPTEFSEKTDNPKYDKMVLNVMRGLGEPLASAAEHLMAYRRASKWLSVYGTGLRNAIYEDDTVHFSVSTQEARTGRSSIKKPGPALQTFPKHPVPRNTIKARPGKKLWAIDYSSQEIRVQAALSGDKAMMAFFDGEDSDYHGYVARLASIPRDAAKTVNYARAYGAGVPNLARSAGVDEVSMQGFLDSIDASFPRAIEWKNEVTALAESRVDEVGYPYVDLPYGRRAALVQGMEYTTAANTEIQGHGADVLKLAGSRIAAAGLGDSLILPMHDEYLVELDEDDNESAYKIARLMEDDFLQVTLTCDVTGPLDRWGEAYE